MTSLIHVAAALAHRPSPHAVPLLDPPLCYGAWRGPRLDLEVLGLRVREAGGRGAQGVVLSDIPDDDASLIAGLTLPGVLGALAVGCGHLDLWVLDPVATALGSVLEVRRSPGSALCRAVIDSPDAARVAWGVLETLTDDLASSPESDVR